MSLNVDLYSDPQRIWGTWSNWSQCSRPCALGMQHRSRPCTGELTVAEGGIACQGNHLEEQACNQGILCPEQTREWNKWNSWSECSSTCGTGTKFRARVCSGEIAMEEGGVQCPGESSEKAECVNDEACPGWSLRLNLAK